MIFEKQIVGGYRSQFQTRCDDTGVACYFSHEDFPGLHRESFDFPSSLGHTLKGWFYRYDEVIPGRLIIFEHGFGGGHRSYMKEIELLCRHGYLVFAYDHTGCMESGGEHPQGLTQSLRDLNDCLTALKSHPMAGSLDISVMGHSWGGFSTMNIAALHPQVSHIVALCGFVSVELMVSQFFGGLLKPYRKAVLQVEQQANPEFVRYDAVSSLSGTDAKVLLIYSSNDPLVKQDVHYATLQKGLAHKENVRLMLAENKGHNPNYTADAVACLGQYSQALAKANKEKSLTTDEQKAAFRAQWDWDRMTRQDEAVWEEIFKTLDN